MSEAEQGEGAAPRSASRWRRRLTLAAAVLAGLVVVLRVALPYALERAVPIGAERFGFDATLNRLQEELPGGGADELYRGDANLLFRFAQSERLQLRAGGGFNWLSDNLGSNYGFNFTYGGDWFPHRPWIVSAEIDLGTLGNATLFHTRATVGALLFKSEVYAGVDHLSIGNTNLTNLIGGVRVWF